MQSSAAPPKNRRAAPRRPVKPCARVICRKGALSLGPNVARAVIDLSETGACLVLEAELAPGQEVEVEIQAPILVRSLKTFAVVVWNRAAGDGTFLAGVHFHRPLPHAEIQYLASNRPLSPSANTPLPSDRRLDEARANNGPRLFPEEPSGAGDSQVD